MRGLSVLEQDQKRRDRYIGTVVAGRWSVQRRLGGGGEGAVYLATAVDEPLLLAALKIRFAATPSDSLLTPDPLVREHTVLMRLTGPAFPRAVEVGTTYDGLTYLAREYVEGPTLHEVIREAAPLPLNRVSQVVLRLCDAVLALHEAGYWHRDVKPANIVLSGPLARVGNLKLLDFGAAWPTGATSAKRREDVAPPSGTAAYTAPELAEEGTIGGEASELYSIAAIAFELLTGTHVLGRAVESPAAAHEYVRGHQPIPRVPLAPLRPDLPPEVAFAVERALWRDPAGRSTSISAFRALVATSMDPQWDDAWDPAARPAPKRPSGWRRLLQRIGLAR